MSSPLFKTTITIWSRKDPEGEELVMLAADATDGGSYCSHIAFELVQEPEKDPMWDGTEFFEDGSN